MILFEANEHSNLPSADISLDSITHTAALSQAASPSFLIASAAAADYYIYPNSQSVPHVYCVLGDGRGRMMDGLRAGGTENVFIYN